MIKKDLWCTYCGTQDFIERKDNEHPEDSNYSDWERSNCHAGFRDNPGYGCYTTWPPDDEHGAYDAEFKYNLSKLKRME